MNKADYATNPLVYKYYRNEPVGLFRNQNFNVVIQRLIKGDTLRVAIDYYALFPGVCQLPENVWKASSYRLSKGEVIVLKIHSFEGKGIQWEEIEN